MKSINWNLNVYITHYSDKNAKDKDRARRIRHLADLILSLARINVKSIDIKIYSNSEKADYLLPISAPLKSGNMPANFEVVVVSDSDLICDGVYNPWLLTWSHKKSLKVDVEKARDDQLFLYLEDDALFDQSNLEYFLNGRELLREFNLIPSYVRAEWSTIHKCWINSDRFPGNQHKDYLLRDATGKSFMVRQFENPYFAAFLLDHELATQYINSESFEIERAGKKHPIIWDTGATAALGLICENVPEGYWHRTAVLHSDRNAFPTIGSVLRHQGDRYANDLWFRQHRLFEEGSEGELASPSRNFLVYLKKLVELGPGTALRILWDKVF